MSSPLSNLKKEKRLPFASTRGREAPYNRSTFGAGEDVLDQFLQNDKMFAHSTKTSNRDLSNESLLSSMTKRLAVVEQKLLEAEGKIKKKDRRISVLEEKLSIYKRTGDFSDGQILELQKKCHRLQKQVHEMETFLEDYGMIWIGSDKENIESDEENEASSDEQLNQNETWKQEDSIPETEDNIDFDLIFKNISELNAIAGEGEHFVKSTKEGACLKVKEAIPITFYSNGIFMFGGPFRSYNEPVTQQCVKDLEDGYFPTELQSMYPDGVPFKVTDRREEHYENERLNRLLFPGEGLHLSPDKSHEMELHTKYPENTKNVSPSKVSTNIRTLNDNTSSIQSVESLISKLPSSVIRKGQIIDIRRDVKETLQPSHKTNNVIVVETDIVKELKSRLNIPKKNRPPTPGRYATLRIKSETGHETFLLKMKYNETIEDLRRYLDEARGGNCCTGYEIKSSFPNETYTELQRSLRDYKLVPNATLYLYVNRK